MKTVLFGLLNTLIVLTLLAFFFFTPIGGLNAYIVDQEKHDGILCQKGFCFEPATVCADYSVPGTGKVTFYFCDKHKSELSDMRTENVAAGAAYYGSFFLIALGLYTMIYCIRQVYLGKYILVLGVLASAIFINFIPWITQVFS